jgi:NADH-quinone oxidoreductase subunit G
LYSRTSPLKPQLQPKPSLHCCLCILCVQADFEGYHDSTSKALTLDLEKCIKCGRCVTMCGQVQSMNVLGMLFRSRHAHPGVVVEEALDFSKCIECGQCSSVCPVGAIIEHSEWRQVLDALENKTKVMVIQTAPSVRVSIGEELGLAPGSVTTGQMVAAQRALGFDYVFDTDFSADLTIMEEGTELLQRLKARWQAQSRDSRAHHTGGSSSGAGAAAAPAAEAGHAAAEAGHAAAELAHAEHAPGPLPMFTSCCPAWINLVEKSYPELIPHLSSCKSPQMMMGAVVKHYWAKKMGLKPEDICLVGVMPCTAKKHETERAEFRSPDGTFDCDLVITTREFGHILRCVFCCCAVRLTAVSGRGGAC